MLVDPVIDSTNPVLDSRRALSSCILSFKKDLNVVDSWHLLNPSIKDYIFSHHAIIHFLILIFTFLLVKCISNVTILPMLLSDHSPITFSLESFTGAAKFKRWRFNMTLLQNKNFLTNINQSVSEFVCIYVIPHGK